VGDARRQLADGLQLLGLAELHLQGEALLLGHDAAGDVLEHPDRALVGPGGVQGPSHEAAPEAGAVGAGDLPGVVRGLAPLEGPV